MIASPGTYRADVQDVLAQFGLTTFNTLFVEGLVAASGLVLYLALFAIFYQAYRRQRRAISRRKRSACAMYGALRRST